MAEALPAGLPIEKAAKTLAVVAGGDLVLIVIATVRAGTLFPFAVYSVLFGTASAVRFGVF
ncbi:MAG: hypothetical protein ACYCUF_11750 [Acidimicrobiales bacterium]